MSLNSAPANNKMWDYYIGPIITQLELGITDRRFKICLSEANRSRLFNELQKLVEMRAAIAPDYLSLVVVISPLHQRPAEVRNLVAHYIEEQLGPNGYIERLSYAELAEQISGTVQTPTRNQ